MFYIYGKYTKVISKALGKRWDCIIVKKKGVNLHAIVCNLRREDTITGRLEQYPTCQLILMCCPKQNM